MPIENSYDGDEICEASKGFDWIWQNALLHYAILQILLK